MLVKITHNGLQYCKMHAHAWSWEPFWYFIYEKNMFYLLCLECVKVLLAQPRIQISVQVRLTKQAQIYTFPLTVFDNLMKNQLTFFLPLWLILFSLLELKENVFAIHWKSRSQLSTVASFCNNLLSMCFVFLVVE